MPFFRIQRIVSLLRVTSSSHRSGSVRYSVTRPMSSKNFSCGIGAEVGIGDFLVGQVGHQRAQILDAVVDATERAGREAAVAAGFILRRALEHQHGNAVFGGRMRGAKRRIAAADDDDIT